MGVTLLEEELAGPEPPGVAALTVNVYAVPVVSPDTVTGEAELVPVIEPGDDVAVYVTVPAPRLVGGVKVMDTDVPLATVAVPIVGAPGIRGQVPAADACMF
jgi:hypothetical protein